MATIDPTELGTEPKPIGGTKCSRRAVDFKNFDEVHALAAFMAGATDRTLMSASLKEQREIAAFAVRCGLVTSAALDLIDLIDAEADAASIALANQIVLEAARLLKEGKLWPSPR